MTAPDIPEAELEELLIYEDLFLEYFNAFLALPAFPVRIFYDRLTGSVRDLDGTLQDYSQEYGANDLQSETTLFWLRHERLSLFRRSPLYLEYKLAKLLLRPLEDPQPASRYGIRGYSRQTNSATLSTSQFSTAPQQSSAPSVWPEEPPGTEVGFPSRVHSTPAAPGYESETYRLSLLEQYGDAIIRLCQPLDPQMVDSGSGTIVPNCPESPGLQLRAEASARADDQEDTRSDGERGMDWTDLEDLYSITEEDEDFVKKHNLTMSALQRLKEEALSSRDGVGRFIRFLQDTQGIHGLHFWMDCEAFKEKSVDLEVNLSPEDARHLCVHLFRRIQNKYQFCLSPECQEQIRLCQQSRGPSYHALRRSQYDALRRLRSYWIPRFLIHRQRRYVVRQGRVKPDAASLEVAIIPSSLMDSSTGDTSTTPGQRRSDRIFSRLDDQKISGSFVSHRMVGALKNEAEAGGAFLHYVNRFEPPKTAQIFLLWQELGEYGEWRSERNQSGASHQVTDVYPETPARRAGDGWDRPPGRSDLSRGIQLADLGSAYHLALAALRDPWIRFLNYDITEFLKNCVPLSLNKSQESESSASRGITTRQKRSNKENRHWGLNYGGGKKVKRKKDPLMAPSQLQPEPNTPLEMLQHRAVYKAYKKLVQETEEPQTSRALEILHALQSHKGDRKVLDLVQKVLELDSIQNPQLQGLRRRLTSELSRGRISSRSLHQVTTFLRALLDASFNRFWDEMFGRLKEYGVEQPGNEGWARLEPILLTLSTKMAMKRLHGRRSDAYHPAQIQPSGDDEDSFNQALTMAAQGWPPPQVLHFLKYLQTHGPQEELPLLENNLLCCLELGKYKNVHHAEPDRGLLKRKVRVIKERFLLLHGSPVLQLSPEVVEAALRDAEAAATHSDLPSISLFNHLHDWLSDSLLPFWAGYRKAWAIRSPSSAQRVPPLRLQQMLRKRLALFEMEETPLKTFHLPPIQQISPRAPPSMVTFSFSMTNGLTLKENSAQTPDPPANRRTSQTGVLPPRSPTSPMPRITEE